MLALIQVWLVLIIPWINKYFKYTAGKKVWNSEGKYLIFPFSREWEVYTNTWTTEWWRITKLSRNIIMSWPGLDCSCLTRPRPRPDRRYAGGSSHSSGEKRKELRKYSYCQQSDFPAWICWPGQSWVTVTGDRRQVRPPVRSQVKSTNWKLMF